MSWLRDYLEYTQHQESPEKFHFWTGLTIIAAALGDKIWLERRSHGITRYRIYPGQMMTILVAGSGHLKKTTAINQGKSLITSLGIPLIKGKASPEAFLKEIGTLKEPKAFLFVPELSVFLSKQSYAEPLVEILQQIFDRDDIPFNTNKGGKISIQNPLVTLLAATNPVSMGDSIPPKAQGTGFTSRIIVVYEDKTDRMDSLTDVGDEDVSEEELQRALSLEQKLKRELQEITQLKGPVSFNKRGKEWAQEHYREWVQSPEGQGEGYPSRRFDHLLRTSMIMNACINKSLILNESVMEATHLALKQLELDFPKAYAYVGTALARDKDKIVEVMTKHGSAGRITSTILHRHVYKYFADLDSIRRTLDLLKTAGIIRYEGVSNGEEIWSLSKTA